MRERLDRRIVNNNETILKIDCALSEPLRLWTYKGNYYHIDMTLEQMLCFRPLPELANYKTPIDNLYLTGAGTHPGCSISGMPGRNCARVFLHNEEPIAQKIKEAGGSIKSALASVLRGKEQ